VRYALSRSLGFRAKLDEERPRGGSGLCNYKGVSTHRSLSTFQYRDVLMYGVGVKAFLEGLKHSDREF